MKHASRVDRLRAPTTVTRAGGLGSRCTSVEEVEARFVGKPRQYSGCRSLYGSEAPMVANFVYVRGYNTNRPAM